MELSKSAEGKEMKNEHELSAQPGGEEGRGRGFKWQLFDSAALNRFKSVQLALISGIWIEVGRSGRSKRSRGAD